MTSAVTFLRRFTSHAPAVPVEQLTDAALVLAARTQDRAGKEAFVEIVRRHQTTVGAVAYGLTGRLALTLFYQDGQSVAAVAEVLELSEDAVKQRLSRGREALRGRIADDMAQQAEAKLAGVLRRVQPGPLLVVSIAAAIGLLAAPSALAAGAFSGATTATTGAATGGSSSATASTFSTAMTASSCLVATITMAAFIPLGWKAREPGHAPLAAPAPAASKLAPPADPFGVFSNSALLREWRRLHEIHGADAAAMPALYYDIAAAEDAFQRRALRSALLAEWAVVDPAGGFRQLLEKNQSEILTKAKLGPPLIEAWAKSDPQAALAWAGEHLRGEARATATASVVKTMAGQDLDAAAAFVARLDPGGAKNRAVNQIVETWLSRDWLKSGGNGADATAKVAGVLQWIGSLPEPDAQRQAVGRASWQLIEVAPEATIAFLSSPPGASAPQPFFDRAAKHLAQKNPESAMQWTAALPSERRAAVRAPRRRADGRLVRVDRLPPGRCASLGARIARGSGPNARHHHPRTPTRLAVRRIRAPVAYFAASRRSRHRAPGFAAKQQPRRRAARRIGGGVRQVTISIAPLVEERGQRSEVRSNDVLHRHVVGVPARASQRSVARKKRSAKRCASA